MLKAEKSSFGKLNSFTFSLKISAFRHPPYQLGFPHGFSPIQNPSGSAQGGVVCAHREKRDAETQTKAHSIAYYR
jgi:hypothetical protein